MAEDKTPWIRVLILAGLALGLGWAWDHWALWPLKIVVVLFHELGHALAAWATGGEVLEIGLSPMQGGYALTRGGSRLAILNAGYLGSLVAGVLLLISGRSSLSARAVTVGLAVVLLALPALLMPWLSFGQIFSAVTGLVVLPLGLVLPGIALRWGLKGLGVFSILYAAYDVWDDVLRAVFAPKATELPSDAAQLAMITGIPAIVWGVAWLVAGLALLIALRRELV